MKIDKILREKTASRQGKARLIDRRSCLGLLPAILITVRAAGAPAGAAVRNGELRYRLDWSFGGKRQRGWNLYLALIAELLDSPAAPESDEFARAVARWQEGAALGASGVLDAPTWLAMVATLQGRRRAGGRQQSPAQLITAPPEDFWDPARPLELRQVEAETHAAWRLMREAAWRELGAGGLPANQLRIISAYRSPAYQAALRRRSPNSGRAGLAINSPHFTGRALDLYVGGEPVSTADWNRQRQVETPAYRWLVKNGRRFGFQPYFYEPWHWEFRG